MLVENRTGAGGNVATEAAARAAPDGYTLVMASMGTHAVNQSLYRTLPFHVAKDFAAVSLVALSHSLLVVHPEPRGAQRDRADRAGQARSRAG